MRKSDATEPVPEWTTSTFLVANDFERIAAKRIELKLRRDEIDHEIAELNLEIGAMLATANVKSVRFGFHRLTLSHATKGGKLSREKLLEAGVTIEQLERATSLKEIGDPFVSVTEISEGSD